MGFFCFVKARMRSFQQPISYLVFETLLEEVRYRIVDGQVLNARSNSLSSTEFSDLRWQRIGPIMLFRKQQSSTFHSVSEK